MEKLSKRELEICEYLAWGYSDKEVADALYISFDTVRSHHQNIYRKTGCRNLSDLTRWFFEFKSSFSFGVRPKLRTAIAAFLLILSVGIELYHLDCLRVRTVRAQRTQIGRRPTGRRKSKTLELS